MRKWTENGRSGDDIDTGSGNYVIYRKWIELDYEHLEFTYWAGGRGNWYIPYIDHDRLTGMEFTGKVVSTQAEKIKVGLQIDEPYVGADHEWEWREYARTAQEDIHDGIRNGTTGCGEPSCIYPTGDQHVQEQGVV